MDVIQWEIIFSNRSINQLCNSNKDINKLIEDFLWEMLLAILKLGSSVDLGSLKLKENALKEIIN